MHLHTKTKQKKNTRFLLLFVLRHDKKNTSLHTRELHRKKMYQMLEQGKSKTINSKVFLNYVYSLSPSIASKCSNSHFILRFWLICHLSLSLSLIIIRRITSFLSRYQFHLRFPTLNESKTKKRIREFISDL